MLSIKEQQFELEIATADNNMTVLFEDVRPELTNDPMYYMANYIEDIANTNYDYVAGGEQRTRYDLVEIHDWLQVTDEQVIENILFKMMCLIITSPKGINAQALAGLVFNKVDFEMKERRLKLAEVFLMAVKSSTFVKIEHKKDEIFFKPTIEIEKNTEAKIKSLGHPLPMLYAPKVKNNKRIGFQTNSTSMISGGALKYHEEDICLDHFNRLNSTCYQVELRLGLVVEPQFDATPKIKDDGTYEEKWEIDERFAGFQRMKYEIPQKVDIMNKMGNRFYIPHYADSRIRTYSKQYHFNYQGMKFIKGMVQFAHKEIIKGDW